MPDTLTESDFSAMMVGGDGVFIDVKGVFRDRINSLDYWSL